MTKKLSLEGAGVSKLAPSVKPSTVPSAVTESMCPKVASKVPAKVRLVANERELI
jgi:hypothetical protein